MKSTGQYINTVRLIKMSSVSKIKSPRLHSLRNAGDRGKKSSITRQHSISMLYKEKKMGHLS